MIMLTSSEKIILCNIVLRSFFLLNNYLAFTIDYVCIFYFQTFIKFIIILIVIFRILYCSAVLCAKTSIHLVTIVIQNYGVYLKR